MLEGWGGSFYIEVLAAGAAAAVAVLLLIRAPRARLHAGGALIALGALLALHYVGVMIQIAKYSGGGSLRIGGALGVAGALVAALSGHQRAAVRAPEQSARRSPSDPTLDMRTYVRRERGDDPACRPGRVLRVGRAARRPSSARAARDRRRRVSCSPPATRPRPTASARRWAAGRLAACARRRSSSRRAWPPTPRRARRCSASSSTRRPWSKGCRSTRRFSTFAGCVESQAHPSRSPCGCGATSSSRSACRSRSASRGPSSSPRSRAAWPSPTVCSWCRPTASWTFSTRSPSSGSGASGR